MSTASAPARKEPGRIRTGAVRLTQWFLAQLDSGFTARPTTLSKRLYRCCEKTELGVLDNLLDETIGNEPKRRPEWARITAAEFAEWIGVTKEAVYDAIESLEARKLIESRPAKDRREKEYRVRIENWSTTPERPARTLLKAEAADEQKGEELENDSRTPLPLLAKLTVPAGGRQRAQLGAMPYEFRNRTEHALDIQASGDEHRIFIDFRDQYWYSTPTIPAAAREQPVTRLEPLRDLLTTIFLRLCHKIPDDELLRQIDAELGEATVQQYAGVIDATRRKKRDRGIESGLFIHLATEARLAAVAEAHLPLRVRALRGYVEGSDAWRARKQAVDALEDPESSEESRAYARKVLGESESNAGP
jgi:hypothetical protein